MEWFHRVKSAELREFGLFDPARLSGAPIPTAAVAGRHGCLMSINHDGVAGSAKAIRGPAEDVRDSIL